MKRAGRVSVHTCVRHACVVWLGLALTALAAAAHSAETDPLAAEIARLEAAVDSISREQQSVYQQFQMVQELRRNEAQQGYESQLVYTPPATPPNYEDVQSEQRAREARLRDYQAELDRLYSRYKELEAQKQPLLERIGALAQERAQVR